MSKKRQQINFVADDEIRGALDEIRILCRPSPTVSETIRQAILDYRDALRRKVAAQERKAS